MNYLLSQIFLCLLAAFILGFIIGWLWKKLSHKRDEVELIKLRDRLAHCKKDLAAHKSLKEKITTNKKTVSPFVEKDHQTEEITEITAENNDTIPAFLNAPRGGKADDLKRIKGIGKVLEGILFEQGVYHFDQIASWSDDNAKWMDTFMKFPGRIEREKWIEQATLLAKGKETEFSKKVDTKKIYD